MSDELFDDDSAFDFDENAQAHIRYQEACRKKEMKQIEDEHIAKIARKEIIKAKEEAFILVFLRTQQRALTH
jgi:hypothetical protein